MSENRLYNSKNPNQGTAKRVLCVCSAGLLRSPTAARVLAEKFNHNTRSCGAHSYALIQLDAVLLHWADEVIFMEDEHREVAEIRFADILKARRHFTLDVPDYFPYNDPELRKIIEEKYKEKVGV